MARTVGAERGALGSQNFMSRTHRGRCTVTPNEPLFFIFSTLHLREKKFARAWWRPSLHSAHIPKTTLCVSKPFYFQVFSRQQHHLFEFRFAICMMSTVVIKALFSLFLPLALSLSLSISLSLAPTANTSLAGTRYF